MGITLEVANLGPLRSAKAEVADLMLLIGENNTGKTVFATLLHRVLGASASAWGSLPTRRLYSRRLPAEVRKWIEREVSDLEGNPLPMETPRPQPTDRLLNWATEFTTSELRGFGTNVRNQVEYAFGIEASELRRRTIGEKAADCHLRILNSDPDWQVEIRFDSGEVQVVAPNPHKWLARMIDMERSFQESASIEDREILLFRSLGWESQLWKGWPKRAVHLPAGRTGIMQSYQVLASAIVRQSTMAGIRPIELDPLPGTSADFLSQILETRIGPHWRSNSRDIRKLVATFEDQLEASIELEKTGVGHAVVAVMGEGRFPLSRTSSMLSELAPLLLVLKGSVDEGDHLTIDEPEAHLHPKMQRDIASFITGVVNCGVGMTLTTHSDYFLGELNNLIRAGELRTPRSPDSSRLAESVDFRIGALHFSKEESWCVARSLDIDPIDGITDSSFTDVMESLYDESALLINELMEESSQ